MRLTIITLLVIISISPIYAQIDISQPDMRVAYITFDDDLFIANADGSNHVQVSSSDQFGGVSYPVWLPDGTQLAFVSLGCGDGWSICVVDENGTNQSSIVDNLSSVRSLRWSPNAHMIAYSAHSENDTNDIYIVQADGSELRSLTDCERCDSTIVSWSPDGEKIAILSEKKNETNNRTISNIYVIDLKRDHLIQITDCDDCTDYRNVIWSPDSTQLVFTRYEIGSGRQTYLANIEDGEIFLLLTNCLGCVVWAADSSMIGLITQDGICVIVDDECLVHHNNVEWQGDYPFLSPDVSRIVTTGINSRQLFIRNMDGSGEQQITFHDHPAEFASGVTDPAWSPDGNYIAYRSSHEGYWALYIVSVDGSYGSKIADNVLWFSWQPEPK